MKKYIALSVLSVMLAMPVSASVTPSYTLSTAAEGGSISGAGTYTEGSRVTVTAIPDGGHYFANWTGDLSGNSNPEYLSMWSNKSVGANFAPAGCGPYWMSAQGLSSVPSFDGKSVSFMTRQFGKSGLLLNVKPTGLVVDAVGKPLQGRVAADYRIDSDVVGTFHTISTNSFYLRGIFYVIPYATDSNGVYVFGNEFTIKL